MQCLVSHILFSNELQTLADHQQGQCSSHIKKSGMKWICFILLSFLFVSYDCAPKFHLIEIEEDPVNDERDPATVLNEDGGEFHEGQDGHKSGDYGAKR